jgi:uncharacterized RmlC-like cupin family protein
MIVVPQQQTTCRVIRSTETYTGKQGPSYSGAISADSVGARAIWLGTITMAPGTRTRAHLHDSHETAMYVLAGEANLYSGTDLQEQVVIRTGDYLFVPAGVPHVAVNLSQTEPLVVVAARTDPSEQESVVLLPDLDRVLP